MKLLAALFAAGAVATSLGTPVVKKASLVERDGATVTSAIAAISDATTQLSTAVQGFTGAAQAAAVQSASENVISVTKSGTSAVQGSAELTQEEALTLTTPVQSLGTLVNSTVDAVIAKKQAFVDAGVGAIVYDQLTQQRDAAKAFSDAVTAKVPEALRSIAANLAAPINAALDKGVAAFQDQQGSGGGSASASGTATSASASGTASSGSGGASSTGASTTAATSGSGSNTTTRATSTSAAAPTASEFTGAAMPTAFVEYGAIVAAALVAAAAL